MRVKCRATELNTGALASVRPYPQIWTAPPRSCARQPRARCLASRRLQHLPDCRARWIRRYGLYFSPTTTSSMRPGPAPPGASRPSPWANTPPWPWTRAASQRYAAMTAPLRQLHHSEERDLRPMRPSRTLHGRGQLQAAHRQCRSGWGVHHPGVRRRRRHPPVHHRRHATGRRGGRRVAGTGGCVRVTRTSSWPETWWSTKAISGASP